MVFFVYTGTFKLFNDILNMNLDLVDQYEISIFIAIQNRDFNLALKYMQEENFLIDMILSILGWMGNYPNLFPWWTMIMEKLTGIELRNKEMIEKWLEQLQNSNQDNANWNNNIITPPDTSLPDDSWAKPDWNNQWNRGKPPGGGTWQPRPRPWEPRPGDGSIYPPIPPVPLPPVPKPWDDREQMDEDNIPPPPPDDWGDDNIPDDWERPPPPPEEEREPPYPPPEDIDRRNPPPPPPPGTPPDTRRRCGY